MTIKILENKTKDLCLKLSSSGKNEQANYFKTLLERIKNPVNDTDKEFALQQIISSGKIADMANFNSEEDRLLELLYNEAKKIKTLAS